MYRLSQIILNPKHKTKSIGDVFVAEPDNLKKSVAGQLFILIETQSKEKKYLSLMNFLINNVSRNYYQNEKLLLKDSLNFLGIEHIFESSLAKTNKDFEEFLNKEKLKINLSLLNVLVGVIHNNKIYLSGYGNNKAFLIYKAKDGGDYKITNINKNTGRDKKLFSSVINGEIPPDSHFIFTNESLPEYISEKQLIKIISTLPANSAGEQIKQTLSQVNTFVPFYALILKNTQADNLTPPTEEKPQQDSIVTLNQSEDRTEKLLSPSGLISPKKFFSFVKKIFKFSKNKKTLDIKDKILVKRKGFVFFQKIKKFFSSIIFWFLTGGKILFKIITATNKSQKIILFFKKIPSFFLGLIKHPWRKLNFKSKILLFVFIVITSVFVINIMQTKEENTEIAKKEDYEKLVQEIEQKQSQAEAKLLYNNENGAKKLFDEIKDLIEKLPQENKEQKEKYEKFKKTFISQLEKTWHITKIEKIEKIADFKEIDKNAKTKNIIFNPHDNSLYIADKNSQTIYKVKPQDKLITSFSDFKENFKGFEFPMILKDFSLYYLSPENVLHYEPQKNKYSKIDINFTNNFSEIINAEIYSDKIYTINKKDGQIYKYKKYRNKFNPQKWLNQKTNLENSTDLSIDGFIYVLFKDGQIKKYLRGVEKDFQTEEVKPPFKNAKKIIASLEKNYIYVLEPANQRVVIFDKDGEFIAQYQNQIIAKSEDFTIDEENKYIYLLADNSIYEFQISLKD